MTIVVEYRPSIEVFLNKNNTISVLAGRSTPDEAMVTIGIDNARDVAQAIIKCLREATCQPE